MISERLAKRGRKLSIERGHPMVIFANEHLGVLINQFGVYEGDELDVVFEFLAPLAPEFANGTAIDVGANVGNHAMYFARRFRDVHAFEPSHDTYRLLELNAGWATGITTHRLGLSDVDHAAVLELNPYNSGAARVLIGQGDHPGRERSIELRRLDGLGLELGDVSLVKVDVEGHEAQALRGAEDTIRRHQPVILLEQHRREFDGDETESIRLLRSWGYELCWHASGSAAYDGWRRTVGLLRETIGRSRVHRLDAGRPVPPGTYPMLIAIPERHRSTLGLDAGRVT